MTELGLLIKLHRELKGWNQKELAEKADVSPATISGTENGRFVPTPTVLHRVAVELNVPFHKLASQIPAPKLNTLLEVAALYLYNRDTYHALELVHRIRTEEYPLQEYQLDELTCIEASALTIWSASRMEAIETLYSLSHKMKGSPLLSMRVQNALGVAWHWHSDYVTAVHHFRSAIEIMNNFPTPEAHFQAPPLINIGDCLRWLGRYREAIPYIEQAIPLMIQSRNIMSIGACYFNLAHCYVHLGDIPNATIAYLDAIPYFEAAKAKWFTMRCRSNIYFYNPELVEEAISVLEEEARELQDEIPPKDIAFITTRIAKIHVDRQEFAEAEAAFEKVAAMLNDSPQTAEQAYFLMNYAKYFFAREDYETASHYAFEAADLYASLRLLHADLQESLRIGKEAVLRLRKGDGGLS